jgi:hypothetical protein
MDKKGQTRFINLRYKTKKSSKHQVINLDEVESVKSIHCRGHESMLLLFNSEIEAQDFANLLMSNETILTGGHQWGCFVHDNSEGRPITAILRKVTSVNWKIHGNGRKVSVTTVRSGYEEVFEHADISLSMNAFHEEHMTSKITNVAPSNSDNDSAPSSSNKRHLGLFSWVSNAVRKVWNGVSTIAKDVGAAVAKVAKAIEVLVTGNYDYSNNIALATFDWNFDSEVFLFIKFFINLVTHFDNSYYI